MAVAQQGRDVRISGGEVLTEWIDPHLPTVFSRWHREHEQLQRASAAAVIAAAEVEPGDTVLDIGSGAGIPALELARVVGAAGKVVATDPSPIFIEALKAHAREDGLTNLEAVQTDVLDLPFGPDGFDAVTCHMGVMFFLDVPSGLRAIREVLKPGGRAGFVAWGPDGENTFFSSFWEGALPYLPAAPGANAEPAAMDAPGPMRFAAPGLLAGQLRLAGFGDVREEARVVEMVWPGTVETLARQWFEIPRLEARVTEQQRADLRESVLRSLRRYADGERVRVTAPIVVASGMA